jgi:hypothetical protein
MIPTVHDPCWVARVAAFPCKASGTVDGTDTLGVKGCRMVATVDAVEAVERAVVFGAPERAPELMPTPLGSPNPEGVGSYDVHPVAGPR